MKKVLLVMMLMALSLFAGPKDYVLVEGGSFVMGNNNGEDDEYPEHEVTVSSFYMSKYEVTQKEFESIMGFNPSQFIGDNNPVEQVTWYDAVMYANKLSQKEGKAAYYTLTNIEKEGNNITYALVKINKSAKGYRLPTEAEWEYAARGGQLFRGRKYSGSNNIDEVAEYEGNNNKSTKPVGGKKANELGIYDMSGNVWEWCWDWYGDYSYSTQTNPTGPASGTGRVVRGGSWFNNVSYAFVFGRSYDFPYDYDNYLGFRLVRAF